MGKKNDTITLQSMDEVVSYLSDNVNRVSYDVDNISNHFDEVQNKVDNMQVNVRSLENEIRTFMKEVKQNALINNANQTIMMSQMEYDKKYKYRDEVRRRITGLLQSIDANIIKKSTIETIGEETIINNPDYWLAPALVAICHWYSDNLELANIALKNALDRSVEKTSLLLCLIHLRANRLNTAEKWLKKYLETQDPTNMDCKIILILDALCSGVFNQESANMIINQIEKWFKILNNYPQYKNNQIPKWEKYFKEQQTISSEESEQFINLFVKEKDQLKERIKLARNHNYVIKKFKENINKPEKDKYNKQTKIDRLINMLIFDYEKDELELKLEIEKNKQILNIKDENTNDEYISDNKYIKTDLYTHLSNMCLNNDSLEINEKTRKLAFCLSKGNIIEAYTKIYGINKEYQPTYLNIVIDDWTGITQNGSNEFELIDNLYLHIQNKYRPTINKNKLISIDMIIAIILTLIVGIVFRKHIIIILLVILISLIYNGYKLYKHYKEQQLIKGIILNEQKSKKALLICTITEIVDCYFIYKESNKIKENFIKYLETLNYNEYIKIYRENNRNIMIGGQK